MKLNVKNLHIKPLKVHLHLFSAMFSKGDNFRDFLFAFLGD